MKDVIAWLRNAAATVQAYYAVATTYISKEPIDFGSLSLGAAAGLAVGGRFVLAAAAGILGYYLRNTERVHGWFAEGDA